MKKALQKLNIYYQCSALSGFFLLLISLLLIPLYFFNLKEIPLGILLGGIYGILIFYFTGLLNDKLPNKYRWAIIIAILRFFLFGILLFLVGLCYYYWDVKLFNIFGVFGGYLFVVLIFIILQFIDNKKEKI